MYRRPCFLAGIMLAPRPAISATLLPFTLADGFSIGAGALGHLPKTITATELLGATLREGTRCPAASLPLTPAVGPCLRNCDCQEERSDKEQTKASAHVHLLDPPSLYSIPCLACPIPPPNLLPFQCLHSTECLPHPRILVKPDLAHRANPAPPPHEHHAAEEVALHVEGIEPAHVPRRLYPPEANREQGRGELVERLHRTLSMRAVSMTTLIDSASAAKPSLPHPL